MDNTHRKVSIIGVPFVSEGGCVSNTPGKMINLGLANQLEECGWEVQYTEINDIDQPALLDPIVMNLKHPKQVSKVNHHVSKLVYERAKQGDFVLTLGGEHSISLATVSGIFAAHPNACLIWVDSHADINTPISTKTGHVNGCVVSFLTGIFSDHPDFQWVKKCVDKNKLVYIGLRDVDEAEKRILKEFNIKAFSMYHVDKFRIEGVIQQALDHVNPQRQNPIHLTFDMDALDASVLQSENTPVSGGLTFREGHLICESLAEIGLLVAADIMEVKPQWRRSTVDVATLKVACSLSRCCLGETLL